MQKAREAYGYWKAALQGDFRLWRDDPMPGFYRRKLGKGGGWQPVAVWMDQSGALRCLDGAREVEPWRYWDRYSHEPTTEADYRAKVNGTPYRDELLAADASGWTTDVTRAAPIGPTPRRTHGHQAQTPARRARGRTDAK